MNDRKKHWETVYTGKSPSGVSWYQAEPVLSLKLIGEAGLDNDDAVIDVGGGASTLVDVLLREGYTNVTVLDIADNALQYAQARLGARASRVEWIEADVTKFVPPHRYQLWHDRAVFHFLTDASDRQRYVAALKQALEPGGQVIMQTFAIGGPKKCSGLDIVQFDTARLLAELGPDFQMLQSGHETHVTPAGVEQAFAWFHLRLEHG